MTAVDALLAKMHSIALEQCDVLIAQDKRDPYGGLIHEPLEDEHAALVKAIAGLTNDIAEARAALAEAEKGESELVAALQYWLGNVDPEGRFAPSWHKEAIRLSRAAIAKAQGR